MVAQPGTSSTDSTVLDDHHESPVPTAPVEHVQTPQPQDDDDVASSVSSEDFDDDPLYDARADDEDERWVRRTLARGQRPLGPQLTCPSCFALLCVQSQPHEEYIGQFRAVFVQNCEVDRTSSMRVRVEDGDRNRGDRSTDRFRAVSCARCATDVAVLDEDEVYHFCNVLS
jgi:hypothetical protein